MLILYKLFGVKPSDTWEKHLSPIRACSTSLLLTFVLR
jgi:hypothetical protein